MKILDVVKTTATLLARVDVIDYLCQTNEGEVSKDTLETVDLLTRLCNLVVTELAEGLILMKSRADVDGKRKVEFSELGISPLDVTAVFDSEGNKLDFVLSSRGVSVYGGDIYSIEYSYLPENYGLNDTIGEFEKPISAITLSHGVAAEFLLTEARFDEAVMWHERFVDGVNALIKPKNGRIKGRRFV